jgi:hypothetical protein
MLGLAACGGGGNNGGSSSRPAIGQSPPPSAPAQQQATVGAATLFWMPPAANTDGSPVVLAGYRILYGTDPDVLNRVIDVPNPSITTYVVEGLSSGTWYFAVVAVNSQGATSDRSNIVSKVIS